MKITDLAYACSKTDLNDDYTNEFLDFHYMNNFNSTF